MEIKEAKYVLAIAKYQSINKAAKALYISQPSLSKYLHNLEYRMGVRLFDHIQNKYVPTYIGERYINYARKLIQIDNEWLQELQDIQHSKIGKMNIGAPIVRSTCLIPQTIARFHKEYPDIEINIFEMAANVEKVLEEQTEVDAVIYNVDVPPKHLNYTILGRSEITMVVPKDHPFVSMSVPKKGFKYNWIDLSMASQEPFILLHDEQTTEKLLNQFFHDNSFIPNVWMRTRSSEVAIRMVLQKSGITFANENYVKNLNLNQDLVCLSTGSKPLFSTLIAACRQGQYLPEHLKRYLEIVRDSLSS